MLHIIDFTPSCLFTSSFILLSASNLSFRDLSGLFIIFILNSNDSFLSICFPSIISLSDFSKARSRDFFCSLPFSRFSGAIK